MRIWNIKSRKVVDWQQTSHYITALAFAPPIKSSSDSDNNSSKKKKEELHRLVVGLVNGEILIYDSAQEKLRLLKQVHTRQATIKKFTKNGKKVNGIEFINSRMVVVTTNDSRIRVFEIKVTL